MYLTSWEPWTRTNWNALNRLHHEVNRLFDDHGQSALFPRVNLFEDADGYDLEAELPGLELGDLEITITGPNQLTLKGERKADSPENAVVHRQERPFGSFVRSLSLPTLVDADKVEAKFADGVLSVRLPKHEQAKPRKISIKY